MLITNLPRNNGFTLIEVLVSMVIMAVGLLGLAGLQTLSLRDNQDDYLSSQATALAYEMSDRIRANAAFWQGPVPTPSCPAANLCNNAANPCDAAAMANLACMSVMTFGVAVAVSSKVCGMLNCRW